MQLNQLNAVAIYCQHIAQDDLAGQLVGFLLAHPKIQPDDAEQVRELQKNLEDKLGENEVHMLMKQGEQSNLDELNKQVLALWKNNSKIE